MTDLWPLRSEVQYHDEVRALVGDRLLAALQRIRLVALDCDGIMTTGVLLFGPDGEALKEFHARDGLGLMMLHDAGVKRAMITGRESAMVERRCRDLKFEQIVMARLEKSSALDEVLAATGCALEDTLYMGDDLLDLPPLVRAGVAVTVPGAPDEVREACAWVTRAEGGRGAVREVCDLVLKSQGRYAAAIRAVAGRDAAGSAAAKEAK